MKRILIDFDRVVHLYSDGWKDGSVYDTPVDGAISAIKKLQSRDWQVVIFTTRSQHGDHRNNAIAVWLRSHGLNPYVEGIIKNVGAFEKGYDKSCIIITNTKIPARAIVDDRAIRFTNWQDILNYFI